MLGRHRLEGEGTEPEEAGTVGTGWVEEHRAAATHSCQAVQREPEGQMRAAAGVDMAGVVAAEDSAHHKVARHSRIPTRAGRHARAAPWVRAEVDNGRYSGEAMSCAGRELAWSSGRGRGRGPDHRRLV